LSDLAAWTYCQRQAGWQTLCTIQTGVLSVKLIQKLRESWLTHQEIEELDEYVKHLELEAARYRWLKKYTSQLLMVTEQQTDKQIDEAMGKNNG
jgi:hypothetical protein